MVEKEDGEEWEIMACMELGAWKEYQKGYKKWLKETREKIRKQAKNRKRMEKENNVS